MKIVNITRGFVEFDNGKYLKYYHEQDCCECNYADFEQIDDIAMEQEFSEELKFEKLEHGFRFGDERYMVYVPCYSIQNGFYSSCVDIYFDDKEIFCISGEICD